MKFYAEISGATGENKIRTIKNYEKRMVEIEKEVKASEKNLKGVITNHKNVLITTLKLDGLESTLHSKFLKKMNEKIRVSS